MTRYPARCERLSLPGRDRPLSPSPRTQRERWGEGVRSERGTLFSSPLLMNFRIVDQVRWLRPRFGAQPRSLALSGREIQNGARAQCFHGQAELELYPREPSPNYATK